jgi:hypothetical protein
LVEEMRNLGIFRLFLATFMVGMRVYMFWVEKVSKIGLFWLSLFLCYLSLVYSGCQLMGKYMLFVMGVWCGSMVVIANMVCFVFLSIGIIVLES